MQTPEEGLEVGAALRLDLVLQRLWERVRSRALVELAPGRSRRLHLADHLPAPDSSERDPSRSSASSFVRDGHLSWDPRYR